VSSGLLNPTVERSSLACELGVGVVILALGLVVGSCSRDVPNMTCKAEGIVQGPVLVQFEEGTDVFRVTNGRLYHRYSGREEYLYGDIREVEPGRYVSGHMVFVMDYDKRHGYVVLAGPQDWRVTYLDCKS
jgi:hypothetical protein